MVYFLSFFLLYIFFKFLFSIQGWTGGEKNALVLPDEIGVAHAKLGDKAPRGYFYWCISTEGQIPTGHKDPLYYAAGLNEFLHVRT